MRLLADDLDEDVDEPALKPGLGAVGGAVASSDTLLAAKTPRPHTLSEGVRYCGKPCS